MLSHPLENCFAAAFAAYSLCLPNMKVTGFWAQYTNLVLTLKEVGWRPWTHKPETSWETLELRPRTLKQSVACSIKNQSGEHGSHYQPFHYFQKLLWRHWPTASSLSYPNRVWVEAFLTILSLSALNKKSNGSLCPVQQERLNVRETRIKT